MKYWLEADGFTCCDWCGYSEIWIDLWCEEDGKKRCVWSSGDVEANDWYLNSSNTQREIRAELKQVFEEHGLDINDIIDYNEECPYDWEYEHVVPRSNQSTDAG